MLGKMLAEKGVMRAGRCYNNFDYMDKHFLTPLFPLSNINIIKHFNYKSMFNIVFPNGNLPRIKDIAYIINLDNKQRSGRH